MWERKLLYVFKVWSEVSPQAELCLPPEEEAQDRVGDCGPVRQFRAGSVPGKQPGRRGRGGALPLPPGDLCHAPAPLPPNIINIASSSYLNYRFSKLQEISLRDIELHIKCIFLDIFYFHERKSQYQC